MWFVSTESGVRSTAGNCGPGAGCYTVAMMFMILAATAEPDVSSMASREVARQECRLPGEGEEIVVCGHRDAQRRYQVTDPKAPFDPAGSVNSVARERSRWIEGGETGTGSCSPVGPGGWTGCMLNGWKRERQQQGWYR